MQSPRLSRGHYMPERDSGLPAFCAALCIKPDFALNLPVEDWGKLLGNVAAVTAMLDRILHHGHILKCGPRSWRTEAAAATE